MKVKSRRSHNPKSGRADQSVKRKPKTNHDVQQKSKTERDERSEGLKGMLPYMRMAAEVVIVFWEHFFGGGGGTAGGGGSST